MKRVAFVMSSPGQGWLGGLSYFRNLFLALRSLERTEVSPVLITDPLSDARHFASFQPIEIVRCPLVEPRTFWWKLRRASQLYLDRDVLFEHFLRRHHIALLSHSGYLGRHCPVPAMPWIPDFQELHLPEFFPPAELAARQRNVMQCCRHATAILLSSQAAHNDLARACARCAGRAHVLPFVASVPQVQELPALAELEQRYGFTGPYFHLPNQFWAHKNHTLVIEALDRLVKQKRPVLVLATGNIEDHRQPGHYQKLKEQIASSNLIDRFRGLGVVPYPDLMALMAHSVAVINPSRFEGWSTTVEEAKSLGKQVVLSDIPVHREQAPERGSYFDPDSPEQLAELLWQRLRDYQAETDRAAMRRAARELPNRRERFARRYEQIVTEVLSR